MSGKFEYENYPIINKNKEKIRYLESGIEKIYNLPRKRKINLKKVGENMLGEVPEGNRPWDI